MNKYLIRFNKTRGNPGRGTIDHVWRVFENNQEYLFKHVKITVPVSDERTGTGESSSDWNFVCEGYLTIDRETSTAYITNDPDQTAVACPTQSQTSK
jgi:hypothetical protein